MTLHCGRLDLPINRSVWDLVIFPLKGNPVILNVVPSAFSTTPRTKPIAHFTFIILELWNDSNPQHALSSHRNSRRQL